MTAIHQERSTCPFCGYREFDEAGVKIHVENRHRDPQLTEQEEDNLKLGSGDQYEEYFQCPIKRCDKHFSLGEIQAHIDRHRAKKRLNESGVDISGLGTPDTVIANHWKHFLRLGKLVTQSQLPLTRFHVDRIPHGKLPTKKPPLLTPKDIEGFHGEVLEIPDSDGEAPLSDHSSDGDSDGGLGPNPKLKVAIKTIVKPPVDPPDDKDKGSNVQKSPSKNEPKPPPSDAGEPASEVIVLSDESDSDENTFLPDAPAPAPPAPAPAPTPAPTLGSSQFDPNGRYIPFIDRSLLPKGMMNAAQRQALISSPHPREQGIIPILARTFAACPSTVYVYLCHPGTDHYQMGAPGPYCGYRNIQMLISHIINGQCPGHEFFGNDPPDVFEIQNMIELAWDQGHNNEVALMEFPNGIRDTNLWIGTAEAQAILNSLQSNFTYSSFEPEKGKKGSKSGGEVHARLLDFVEEHYSQAPGVNNSAKVRSTQKAPLYFQWEGHSVTVIGIERAASGARNLLVFDPSKSDGKRVLRARGTNEAAHHPDQALKSYRLKPRSGRSYEIIGYLPPAPRGKKSKK
ncbi:peptidase family C78-domain-containing protein [Hypoxylon trugodes]|uniref:peptidase family C78-domain-containing protein n=1 Tax=Hypoxylon trugodes TaxID=326681 RepID=UPI00219A3829|nr:peptidase family C78-domain-containing protein [Hypoxylon trugodes]KAI1391148.1 peptidase family C78-domain-containing protein [Hypoxylon trugodes]